MFLHCYVVLAFTILSAALISGLPAAQTSELNQDTDTDTDTVVEDDYGDYDEASKADTPKVKDNGLVKLLEAGGSLAQGLLALLGEKVKFVNNVLADQVIVAYNILKHYFRI